MEGLKYELCGLDIQIDSYPFKNSNPEELEKLKIRAKSLRRDIEKAPVRESLSYAGRHPDEIFPKKVMIK